jgi:hypothetical protein
LKLVPCLITQSVLASWSCICFGMAYNSKGV